MLFYFVAEFIKYGGFGYVCAVAEKRNCIEMSTPGDKCYHSVEYASDFYKNGASVPLDNFGFLVSTSCSAKPM